ncbi:High-affinity leucine-specific transport system, periplasmic binding protein LivK [Cystobacter fuscus DSM 2262]|uniref:High-affinity leucine-specific transport system, periplasmic binding protein LivK n=2 Tax=Cystobacter fuscus TaxID=43 RepID=S9PBP9_CYSF2|nr:High-affinity leucine-specific transport system, periplasmic binding protein LivK [Cystobacter fuscus DSM 2262]
MRQELATNISRVSVTSSSADIPSVSVDLALTNGVWGGTIGNIPAGSNRSFHAQAFNTLGALLFEGYASGITITSGQRTLVAITLQQVNPPPPFQNEAPLIGSLVASSTTVAPGGSISLVATAYDPNPDNTLTYAWNATAGTFSAPTALSTSWTAPATTGIQTLTFTVTDSGGMASNLSLAVNVTQSGGQGDAQINISFNSVPTVSVMSATPTQLAPGRTTALSVSASDPDGDGLSYAWSATCAGSWVNTSSSSAEFTPSELPAGVCNNCQLTVTVSDGRGGQTSGTVSLCISNTPPINHFAPVIVRSYSSSDTATPGQVLTYEVTASDPENSALTFSWSTNTGSLGPPANTASNSRITWTALSCVSAGVSPTITATVTNAFNLTTTKSFSVAGMPTCPSGTWSITGSMANRRYRHTATLLLNGKVLVESEGTDSAPMAEIYDPASGTWSATGSMATPRNDLHTATLLPDGKVLVAGGRIGSGRIAEVYDPALGTWSLTGPMISHRRYHSATLLPNGKVLVVGGAGGREDSDWAWGISTAEVYDPASGTWSATSSMISPRYSHTATLLPNGKVLIIGGITPAPERSVATAEVYDPASDTWTATSSMISPRSFFSATLLPNGKVLVVGAGSGWITTAEVYDPILGTWSATSPMSTTRFAHTATLLPNGKVLVAGGDGVGGELAKAEIYDPASDTWIPAGSMAYPRDEHTATLLPNGKVLITGGWGPDGTIRTAELYTP